MQRLIPTIYFYLLSAVGMALLIIGLFNTAHFVTGIISYDKYPLRFGSENRCDFLPQPIPFENSKIASSASKEDCLKSLEKERATTKADDLEKSISFTIIGLLVFLSHFYFAHLRQGFGGQARKQKSA